MHGYTHRISALGRLQAASPGALAISGVPPKVNKTVKSGQLSAHHWPRNSWIFLSTRTTFKRTAFRACAQRISFDMLRPPWLCHMDAGAGFFLHLANTASQAILRHLQVASRPRNLYDACFEAFLGLFTVSVMAGSHATGTHP